MPMLSTMPNIQIAPAELLPFGRAWNANIILI